MSVQRECAFIEYRPGKWYLLLGRDEHDDLTPYTADAYGPFSTYENAEEYLSNFSNPGGFYVDRYTDGKWGRDIEQLIANAEKPIRQYRYYGDKWHL